MEELNIFIPTDLTKKSRKALNMALEVSRENPVSIDLINFMPALPDINNATEKSQAQIEEELHLEVYRLQKNIAKLHEIKRTYPDHNLNAEIRRGNMAHGIHEHVQLNAVDVLIFGLESEGVIRQLDNQISQPIIKSTPCSIVDLSHNPDVNICSQFSG